MHKAASDENFVFRAFIVHNLSPSLLKSVEICTEIILGFKILFDIIINFFQFLRKLFCIVYSDKLMHHHYYNLKMFNSNICYGFYYFILYVITMCLKHLS